MNKNKIRNLVLMLIFAFIPGFVFADTHVFVGNTDIYGEKYIDDTVKFDNKSNTLTLNGYNGSDGISFEGFEGKEIKIDLFGENKIDSVLDTPSGNAINFVSSEETPAINVIVTGYTGSKLVINGYNEGFRMVNGDISFNNVDIDFTNIGDGGIYVDYGDIDIENSDFDFDSVSYPLYSSFGLINIKDSDGYFNKGDDDIYANKIVIKNSTLESENNTDAFIYPDYELLIDEKSILTYDAPYGIFGYGKVKINDSTINANNNDYNAFSLSSLTDVQIIDSTININGAGAGIDMIGATLFEVNGSIINITDVGGSGINFQGSEVEESKSNIIDSTINVGVSNNDVDGCFNGIILNSTSMNINNSTINDDKSLFGIIIYSDSTTIDNKSTFNVTNSLFAINFVKFNPDADNANLLINDSKMIVDNSKSDIHLLMGITSNVTNTDIVDSEIKINNDSNNEIFVNGFDLILEDTKLELAMDFEGNIVNIKDSNVEISAKYTSDVAQKYPKTGILGLNSMININNSEMKVDVDETGAAIVAAGIFDPGFDILKIDGNVIISDDDLEIKKNSFLDKMVYVWSIDGDVDTENLEVSQDDITNFDVQNIAIKILERLNNKVDIVGSLKLTFDSNDGSGKVETIKSTGIMKTLPSDIFASTDKKLFKGWSLTKDGKIIDSLNFSEDTTLYAIWDDPREYTYEFILDDNEFTFGGIKLNTLKIDGSFMYFDKLEVEGIELVKDVDYTASEGSTIINFTESGIKKLNTLKVGTHKLVATYTNGKTVEYSIKINDIIENPKTGDNIILYVMLGLISIIGLIVVKRHNKNLC